MYMLVVQEYGSSSSSEYAVAVAVEGLCCVICRTMLCDMQDYVMWYTILHYMVYNTSCYVM